MTVNPDPAVIVGVLARNVPKINVFAFVVVIASGSLGPALEVTALPSNGVAILAPLTANAITVVNEAGALTVMTSLDNALDAGFHHVSIGLAPPFDARNVNAPSVEPDTPVTAPPFESTQTMMMSFVSDVDRVTATVAPDPLPSAPTPSNASVFAIIEEVLRRNNVRLAPIYIGSTRQN